MEQDAERNEMLRQGVCLRCAAYRGKKADSCCCMAMTPGCPAPDYMKKKNSMEGKIDGK